MTTPAIFDLCCAFMEGLRPRVDDARYQQFMAEIEVFGRRVRVRANETEAQIDEAMTESACRQIKERFEKEMAFDLERIILNLAFEVDAELAEDFRRRVELADQDHANSPQTSRPM